MKPNPDIPYQAVIVIGAARSGTKLLRDVIALHPSIDKVPYDVNYIWRLGNEQLPDDELAPEHLSSQIRQRILRQMGRYHAGAPLLIEKTVSNCLRIPFVQAVYPHARYIYLVRDGWDVVESSFRQWLAPPDWRYIFQKAATFPITEAFSYAFGYGISLLKKLAGQGKDRPSSWGPRYAGIDEDIATRALIEVVALQWVISIEKAASALNQLPEEQVLAVRYEDFVRQPLEKLDTIARFLEIDFEPYAQTPLKQTISETNIGKGKQALSFEQQIMIDAIISKTQSELNY
jgi:hypothetical protein